MCYASRALTTTEEYYGQVEKELLAIVFSCEKCDQYVYGRNITVQSDQKAAGDNHKEIDDRCAEETTENAASPSEIRH